MHANYAGLNEPLLVLLDILVFLLDRSHIEYNLTLTTYLRVEGTLFFIRQEAK